jgi:hypothetical protein
MSSNNIVVVVVVNFFFFAVVLLPSLASLCSHGKKRVNPSLLFL